MRIALLAPWFRTLAHIHGRALLTRGHEILIVTTDGHFQPGYEFARELVLPSRLRARESLPAWIAAHRELARFSPDVVLADQTWDVRVSSLSRTPSALVIHDAGPHDVLHVGRAWQRWLSGRQRRSAQQVICFSDAVARRLSQAGADRVHVVPLTSEMPDEWPSRPIAANLRQDFLLLGRMSPYKNLDTVFAAWDRHVSSAAYRGDHLVLIGDGHLPTRLPPAARWDRRRFDFSGEASRLARFKASLVMYREASQSGTQVLSMQLGVVPVASNAGGLAEYQPPFRPCLHPADVDGLARALGDLADPKQAACEGVSARVHYEQRFAAEVAAARLESVCEAILHG